MPDAALRIGFALLALLGSLAALGQRPSLVIVVSVDQFRADYLDRLAPLFTTGGFARLAREGAVFRNARQRHAVTSTAPGHAAIGGGTLPSENGIVANRWLESDSSNAAKRWQLYFDEVAPYRSSRATGSSGTPWWTGRGSPRAAVYDETHGLSPGAMGGPSLGGAVKRRYPEARVIAFALTDRAAILMGGRDADAAYWFDWRLPGFVSSSYYRANPAVLAFNELVPGYLPGSGEWRLAPFVPADVLQQVTFDPPEAWPLKNTAYGGTFPHPIPHARALQNTPFAHEMLLDLAQHIIAVEGLGTRAGTPDLLFVGISSTDYLGHLYGPDSAEVADSAARLDRALAHFLDALDRRFGERVLVVLTSDHGVQPHPEIAKLRDPNADAGRIDLRNPASQARRIADLPPARVEIERRLARKLGLGFDTDAPLTQALVFFFEEPTLYLNHARVAELQLDPLRVRQALRDVVASMTDHGVAGAWTRDEPLPPVIGASFRADRSGDVLLALRPGWIWHWGSNSTTHGQPVESDLRVPLMLWGAAVRPGVYDDDASPLDLARTIGAIFGVDAGGKESIRLPCLR